MNSSLSLIEMLSDEYMLKILYATSSEPKSITELSETYDIPIAACYRRIEYLRKKGLIEENGSSISSKGRRTKVYRSRISKIDVFFREGKMVMELTMDKGDTDSRMIDLLTDNITVFDH